MATTPRKRFTKPVEVRRASELHRMVPSITAREIDASKKTVKVTIYKVLGGELEKPATYVIEKGVKVRDDLVAVRLRGERVWRRRG